MTSKEFIIKLQGLERETFDLNKSVFSKEMVSLYEDDFKHFDKVLKDLEILEILKPYIKISSFDETISCHNLIFIKGCESYKEKYDLLEEWLNEKENR